MTVTMTRRNLLRTFALGSAAVWLTSACQGSDPAPVGLTTSLDTDAAGNRVAVLMAKSTPRNGTAPLAIYCHGSGGDALAGFDPVNIGQYRNVVGLAEAGYIIVSSDMGGPATWGNDTAMATIDAAIAHGRKRHKARAGKVLIIGTSMGGAAALAFTARYSSKVAGCIAILPIFDLDAARSHGLPGVDDAYPGGYSNAAYGLDHNPMVQAGARKFAGMPLSVWYADNDKHVPLTTSETFVRAVTANGDPMIGANVIEGTHSEETSATIPKSALVSFATSVLPIQEA